VDEQPVVGARRHFQRLVTQRRSEPLRIATADGNRAPARAVSSASEEESTSRPRLMIST
jgi:hypothetical protein